jgi:D-aminopeptidase
MILQTKITFGLFFLLYVTALVNAQQRPREMGIIIGVFDPGKQNSITDVPGVSVGHKTLIEGSSIRTGVTAIIPHEKDIFQYKCPAGIFLGNGFGKLAGYSQVEELGNLETPIVLTNTLSVPVAMNALISYTLDQSGNENVQSVNAVVGETNDGYLNDIRGRHIQEEDVFTAISNATTGPVQEGNVGAGTGTRCFGYKGGIGTASRELPAALGGYIVGVLVQTNFGGVLEINGVPVGKELGEYPFKSAIETSDGSCMMVVITNAPVNERNLKRMAKRAMLGLAKTGGVASNGSGDYVIALSNYEKNLVSYDVTTNLQKREYLHNDQMTPLFMATIEATEEAIINSLFAAETMTGRAGTVEKIPVERVLEIISNYRP